MVAFCYVGCSLGRFEPRPLRVFVHTCGAKRQKIVTPVQLSPRGLSERFFTENTLVVNFRSTFWPAETEVKSEHFKLQVCVADTP